MASDEQQMPVQVLKLSPNSSNWVTYRDRLKWAMQTNTFDAHARADSPPVDYLALGTVGGIIMVA